MNVELIVIVIDIRVRGPSWPSWILSLLGILATLAFGLDWIG